MVRNPRPNSRRRPVRCRMIIPLQDQRHLDTPRLPVHAKAPKQFYALKRLLHPKAASLETSFTRTEPWSSFAQMRTALRAVAGSSGLNERSNPVVVQGRRQRRHVIDQPVSAIGESRSMSMGPN